MAFPLQLSLTGGAGGNAGPSSNGSSVAGITPAFDASNWTVSTGSSKATASNASGGGLKALPWTTIGIFALAGFVVWKRFSK